MKNYRLSLPFLGLLLALSPLRAQEAAVQQETSEQKDKRMEWFSQAKLGIFIHCIIRKSKFPQNPKRSVRFSGKRTKRSVQKRKARNTQKAETKVL